jgi:hypothetical protein
MSIAELMLVAPSQTAMNIGIFQVMKNLFALLLITASSVAAFAGDSVDKYPVLQMRNGEVFTNAEVSGITAAYATVFYDGGGKKIPLTNFPVELQRKYHFDPARAVAEMDMDASKKQAALDRQQAARAALEDAQRARQFRTVNGALVPLRDFRPAYGDVIKVFPTGILLGPWQHRIAQDQVSDLQSIGGSPTGPPVTRDSRIPGNKVVFVRCPVSGVAVGQRWQGNCAPIGTGNYVLPDGNEAVLEAYDVGSPAGTGR